MLFALKEIFNAAKSSAFTVGCLRTLFYIKKQKVRKHFRCSVSFIPNTNVAVCYCVCSTNFFNCIYKVFIFILFKCIFKFTFMFQQTWKNSA